jgi:hypothetical protein
MDIDNNHSEERDTVEFQSDSGEMLKFEVVDYFLYDGEEYVILADLGKNPEELSSGAKVDVFIMKVKIIDDEIEEFVMIPPDKEEDVLHFAAHLLGNDDDHHHGHDHEHHHHGEELV